MPDAVLVAAFRGDLIDTLIPILFVAIWIITQVFNAFRNAAKAPRQPARPAPVRPVPPQAGQGRPPELDREIEEILRRTLGVEPTRQPSPSQPPRPPKQHKQKQKPKKQNAAAPSRLDPPGGRRSRSDDVARHVEEAFAHDLAHESPSGTAAQSVAAIAASPAADLLASLRSPENVRKLFIAREILEVPTHRW
jgi:hypothetical protein